jgi:hypothetical protein
MSLYIKNSSVWTEPQLIYVRNGGTWQPANVWTKSSGVWTRVFPAAGSQNQSTPGLYSLVIPNGVRSITVDQSGGAGGGGGGGAYGGGSAGQNGYRDTRTLTVTPGETVTIYVGGAGTGGRSGISNCGSNAAAWFAINGDPNQRGGLGYTTYGYSVGTDGQGAGCIFSFGPTGGWAGGGGSSSAVVGSFGTVIAGGGNGGVAGGRPDGAAGAVGAGGSNAIGNQGATGSSGGSGQPLPYSGYGGNGSDGYVNISW